MKSFYKEITGGIRADTYIATFPFAELKISSDEIQITAPGLDTIRLSSDHVIGFVKYRSLLGKGYAIYHNAVEYSNPLIFYANPDKIEQIIKKAGFICCGIGTIDISQAKSPKALHIVAFVHIVFIIIIGILIMLLSH